MMRALCVLLLSLAAVCGASGAADRPTADLARFSEHPVIEAQAAESDAVFLEFGAELESPAEDAAVLAEIAALEGRPAPAESSDALMDLSDLSADSLSLLQQDEAAHELLAAPTKQDSPVVYSNNSPPNPLDAPLLKEQHDAVNYLLQDNLSIKEKNLVKGADTVKQAEYARQRVADFKEKNQHQPLIPPSLSMLETASETENEEGVEAEQEQEAEQESEQDAEQEVEQDVEQEAEAEQEAPEEAAPDMLLQMHEEFSNTHGSRGNYPGWNVALLETQAAPVAAKPAAAKPAAPAAKPVAQKAAVSAEQKLRDEVAKLPSDVPRIHADIVHHQTPKDRRSDWWRANSGISKMHVHVYGRHADVNRAARLKNVVKRLAHQQKKSYKKINALIQKLKQCSLTGKPNGCLPQITAKLEDFQADNQLVV